MTMTADSTEIVQQEAAGPPAKRPATLTDLVASDAFKRKVAQVLPKHLTPDRFVRIAILAMTRTPKLKECSQESLLGALMTLSQFGLEPDGRRAHLIPFKRNFKVGDRWQSVMEVQLIIDYKGLAELVMRSGLVSNIHADIICENDEFDYDRGEIKHHRVNLRQPRGPMYAAYVIVRMKDGGEKSEVMSKDEIDGIRARSKAKDNGPWVTDYNEMSKKTVFRRATKWLSLSAEFRDAMEADEAHDPIMLDMAEAVPVPTNGQPPRRMRMRDAQPQLAGESEPPPERRGAGRPRKEAAMEAPAPEIQPEASGDEAGEPMTAEQVANAFVAARSPSQCRDWIIAQKASHASEVEVAMKVAGIKNLAGADDADIQNAAWNLSVSLNTK